MIEEGNDPVTMFPPVVKKPKKLESIGFRPSDKIAEYVEAAHARGHQKTAVVLGLMELSIDAEKIIGPALWGKLEVMAMRANVSVGTMLGKLARQSLDADK